MSNKNPNNEKELLLLASAGCEVSFTKLFHIYKDRLYSLILRLTKSEEQTLDFIQDIFMKLWINRANLASVDNLGSYIFRSAQNQVINSFRRSMKKTSILIELKSIDRLENNIEANFEYKILVTKLNAVVNNLPPQQKLIYTLSRVEGLKHYEIAEQLKLSPATVKNHMSQALKTIRGFLRNDLNIIEVSMCVIFLGI